MPKDKGINYYFLQVMLGSIIDPTLLQPYQSSLDNRYTNGPTLEAASQHMVNYSEFAIGEFDPYTASPTMTFKNDKQKKQAEDIIDFLDKEYQTIIDNKEIEKDGPVHQFFVHSRRLLTDAKTGIDRNSYMARLDNLQYIYGNPDWITRNKNTGFVATSQQLNDMLRDMKYPDLWELADERCDLEIEMDTAKEAFTSEQKQDFSERIQKLNEQVIAVYEHQLTPEMKEKYDGKFFTEHTATTHSVWGKRGPANCIDRLRKENELLASGWDPTRISEYSRIRRLCENYAREAKALEESGDPAFSTLVERMKKVAELDPAEKNLSGKDQWDTYYDTLSEAITSVISAKPDKEHLKAYEDIVHTNPCLKPLERGKGSGKLEISEFFASRMALPNERSKELRTKAVEEFDKGVSDIRRQAREKLKSFTDNLDRLQKNNSEYYMNMRAALERVATLPADASLNDVNAAMDNLKEKSAGYVRKRTGLIKSSKGKARLDAANDLISFADSSKAEIEKITKHTLIGLSPDKKSSELDPSYQEKFATKETVDESLLEGIEAAMEEPAAKESAEIEPERMRREKRKFNAALEGLVKDFQEKSSLSNDQIGMIEQKIPGKNGKEPRTIRHDEYIMSLSRMIAAKSLQMQVEKGEMSVSNAFNSINMNSLKLEQDKTFFQMAKEARENPAFRKELSEMSMGEIFAKLSLRKHNEKLAQAAQKDKGPVHSNDKELQKNNAPQMG